MEIFEISNLQPRGRYRFDFGFIFVWNKRIGGLYDVTIDFHDTLDYYIEYSNGHKELSITSCQMENISSEMYALDTFTWSERGLILSQLKQLRIRIWRKRQYDYSPISRLITRRISVNYSDLVCADIASVITAYI